MKWLLAAMVYVALVAAAFTQEGWWWPDLHWFIAFIAFCYEASRAIYGVGVRRASAVGFVMGSVILLAAVGIAPEGRPPRRLVGKITGSSGLPLVHQWWATDAIGMVLGGIVGSAFAAAAYRQSRSANES